MNNVQKKEFIDMLLSGTQKKRYEWKRDAQLTNRFHLTFPKSSIVLTKPEDVNNPLLKDFIRSQITISILSKEGNVVERLSSNDFEMIIQPSNILLERLYELVRDQVMGLSETIEDVFNNLKGNKT